jgi:hypothetical protein
LTPFLGGRFHGRGNLKHLRDVLDFLSVEFTAVVTKKSTCLFHSVLSIFRTEWVFPATMKAGHQALSAKGDVVLHDGNNLLVFGGGRGNRTRS